MYEKNGEKYFVVDGHVHFWDGSPDNWRNVHGQQFIECFYDYHAALSPEEEKWTFEKFHTITEEGLIKDLFTDGHVDKAILQPTHLTDFYKEGFNTTERVNELAKKHPDKLIANGAYDPRNGERGLDEFERMHEKYNFKGVKLYTAEWKGESKGWDLRDEWSRRYLDKVSELGIKNVHIHKGPTIRPLNKDAFNVDDVDDVASDYTHLNFIVEHCGLPRLEDFCWIAVQEPNVYAGLAVAIPFIHTRPRYFAEIMGELMYWVGEDRTCFASDYGIWTPAWLLDRFTDFQIPEDMQSEYGTISTDAKKKILGLNMAKLYDIDVPVDLNITEPEDEGVLLTEGATTN
jgi:uncharacterized protein